jgi:hypothetical protein
MTYSCPDITKNGQKANEFGVVRYFIMCMAKRLGQEKIFVIQGFSL